jgi:hypothetical protein
MGVDLYMKSTLYLEIYGIIKTSLVLLQFKTNSQTFFLN